MSLLAAARAHVERGLGVYAGLVFSRSKATGALLALATAFDPVAFVGGLVAVIAALAAGRALGLEGGEAWDGSIGCNALLVGLGVAHTFAPCPATWVLLAASAGGTALVSAALSSMLARVSLPLLSLAFLVVFPLAVATSIHAGLPFREALVAPEPIFAPELDRPLASLGAVLFLARWDVGACVLAALLVHSRIAALFVTIALGVVGVLLAATPVPLDPAIELSARLNAWLTAIALGGVWFVPSTSSLVLGVAGALLSTLASIGLASTASRLGVPLLIVPFYAAASAVLLATRQRAHDRSPKSVDFVPGSPEENLRYHRTRRARFASLHPVAFHLPFRGAWTCTQAVDGAHTHQGPWRFAFDFEVKGEDGEFSANGGATPEDYHCYRLPVLAAADGTVVSIENDVPDVKIGEVDAVRNWGNRVIVVHAAGLYSLVAHLAPGSVKVVPGQIVRRGEVLGLCGSSGRSPRPHLHFQLQGTPELGAPTLPCRFVDAVRLEADAERLERELLPGEASVLRGIDPDTDVARMLALAAGTTHWFEIDGRVERVTAEVSLLGQPTLTSSRGASLPYDVLAEGFVAYDPLGDDGSVLHLMRVALPRLPFDTRRHLRFSDLVPLRWELGPVLHALWDFVAPFAGGAGTEMTYELTRESGRIVVAGRSGRGELRTRVVLDANGIASVELHRGARVRRAARTTEPQVDSRRTPAAERSTQSWIGGRA
jgi:murein DD-endopeptidase MepM/ murein hydrolase activator NlpD